MKANYFKLNMLRFAVFITFQFIIASFSFAYEIQSPLTKPADIQLQRQSEYIYSPEITYDKIFQSGLAYSPFEVQQPNNLSGPVLYGPGGDPIGGIPVSDSIGIFLLLAVVYFSIITYNRLRKRSTNA